MSSSLRCSHQDGCALIASALHSYLVSTYYIQKSQDQEFWDTVKLDYSQDLLALRIRKKVGIVHWLPPGDEDYDRNWDYKAPENTPKLVEKNLRRVLSDAADPSPCARLLNETVDEKIERTGASQHQNTQSSPVGLVYCEVEGRI